MPLEDFHPVVRQWFNQNFSDPSEIQSLAWPEILNRRNVLLSAPTGSGKTLAAFLAVLNDLFQRRLNGSLEDRTQVVYVSPLKALSNDIHRNLQVPLKGIRALLEQNGYPDADVRAMVRTGDTPASERAKMVRTPPHILVTTPESLYLLLTSNGGREMLSSAGTLIVDEIHAVAGNKRGAHLSHFHGAADASQPEPGPPDRYLRHPEAHRADGAFSYRRRGTLRNPQHRAPA